MPWRRADLGALNGHGNARAIATLQSILACGEANGVRLMSESGRERVLEQQSDGVDAFLRLQILLTLLVLAMVSVPVIVFLASRFGLAGA